MKSFLCLALAMCCAAVAAADGPVLLVTPQGVWESTIVNGVPGAWVPKQIDVIVHGFGSNPNPPVPNPPGAPADPVVASVAAVSKSLKDGQEAMAVAAIVDALVKAGIQQKDLAESLRFGLEIADASLKSDGRLIAWGKSATAITADPVKLKAGVLLAFNLTATTMEAVSAAAASPEGTPVVGEALNFAAIIKIIQFILTLLQSMGKV